MYNILICDDSQEFVHYIKRIIFYTGLRENEVIFYEFDSGKKLADFLKKGDAKCDLLILDIHLPDMNGNEAAVLFRKRFVDAILVFCSGVYLPSDESFKVMAFRYLLKTYSDKRMLSEMKDIVQRMVEYKRIPSVIGYYRYKTVNLKPDEILYIENNKRGSRLHLCPDLHLKEFNEDMIFSSEKLSNLYKKLKDYGFAYAHNSYIVNLNYVREIAYNELVFRTWNDKEKNMILSVSRSKFQELRERFTRYMGDKY